MGVSRAKIGNPINCSVKVGNIPFQKKGNFLLQISFIENHTVANLAFLKPDFEILPFFNTLSFF